MFQALHHFIELFAWTTAIVGLLVGFFVGLTGVGGGVLLAPILIYLGIQPSVAVGTDMVYGSVTKIVATVRNIRHGRVDWSWVRIMAMGSVPAGVAGSYTVHWLRLHDAHAEKTILHFLGAVLVLASAVSLLNEFVLKRHNIQIHFDWSPNELRTGWRIAALAAAVGFLVGLTSVGSGSLFALLLLFTSRLDAPKLVGTDIAHATLLVGAASLAHVDIGTVDFRLAGNLLVGSIPGVLIGSKLMTHAPSRLLKPCICTLVLAAGAKMVLPA